MFKQKQKSTKTLEDKFNLRRISTGWNDRQFHREITTKLIRHETIFNFHMNKSLTVIVVTFKNVKSNGEFCSTFISLIEIVEHKKHKFPSYIIKENKRSENGIISQSFI